jgi:hypothetical protein
VIHIRSAARPKWPSFATAVNISSLSSMIDCFYGNRRHSAGVTIERPGQSRHSALASSVPVGLSLVSLPDPRPERAMRLRVRAGGMPAAARAGGEIETRVMPPTEKPRPLCLFVILMLGGVRRSALALHVLPKRFVALLLKIPRAVWQQVFTMRTEGLLGPPAVVWRFG